jgi:hypothetical protein
MRDFRSMTEEADTGRASTQGDEDLSCKETGDVLDRVSGLWVAALFCTLLLSVPAVIFALLGGVPGWIVLIAYPVVGSTLFIGLTFLLVGLRDGRNRHGRSSKTHASWSQTASPAPQTDEARSRPFVTWSQREPRDTATHAETKLAFCVGDERRGETAFIAETLGELNFSVNICNDLDEVLASIVELARPCHTLVVDLDFVERSLGLDEIVGALQLFRQLAPQVRVLVLSSDFARHDFGTERLSIADVCLRSPVQESALRAGLTGAAENNVVWLRRRSDATGMALA